MWFRFYLSHFMEGLQYLLKNGILKIFKGLRSPSTSKRPRIISLIFFKCKYTFCTNMLNKKAKGLTRTDRLFVVGTGFSALVSAYSTLESSMSLAQVLGLICLLTFSYKLICMRRMEELPHHKWKLIQYIHVEFRDFQHGHLCTIWIFQENVQRELSILQNHLFLGIQSGLNMLLALKQDDQCSCIPWKKMKYVFKFQEEMQIIS